MFFINIFVTMKLFTNSKRGLSVRQRYVDLNKSYIKIMNPRSREFSVLEVQDRTGP